MVAKKRNKQEMYIDALRAIQTEESPLRIMGTANLSWEPFMKEVLPRLIREGLIVEQVVNNPQDKRHKYAYRVTQKGREVLKDQKVAKS